MRQIRQRLCAHPNQARDTGCSTGAQVDRCPEFSVRAAGASGASHPALRQESCLYPLPQVVVPPQAWQQPDVSEDQPLQIWLEETETRALPMEEAERVFSYQNVSQICYLHDSLTRSLRIMCRWRQNRRFVS